MDKKDNFVIINFKDLPDLKAEILTSAAKFVNG
jgi:hypothetical protein